MPKNAQTTSQLHSSHILVRRRQWHPTPVLLPGKSHGQRSLVGCSPWCRKESGTTEQLKLTYSCSAGGLGLTVGSGRSPREGNGNPLQYSCLENSMSRGSWQGTVHGVSEMNTERLTLAGSGLIPDLFKSLCFCLRSCSM